MNIPIYIGLVHYPIKNKQGEEVTTSVTNLDVHDISRSCRTYGIKRFFIITPIKAQHEILGKILGYWKTDEANIYNPDRQDALSCAQVINSINESIQKVEEIEGERPYIAVTGANFTKDTMSSFELNNRIRLDNRPLLLLFGTGYGLMDQVVDEADFKLGPLFGAAQDGYNHLSVRSAVAIYCDRLKNND